MREIDVLIAGAGHSGVAAARAAVKEGAGVLIVDKRADAADPAVADAEFLAHRCLVDVILAPDGAVAGALVADPDAWRVDAVRAKAVVLATGGASALWPAPRARHETADAFAIAHRAGADVEGLHPALQCEHTEVAGGVSSGSAGRTSVDGLWVAGLASARRVDGAEAGRAAARTLPKEARPFGDHAIMSNVDSRLPAGFADVKLARLQELMGAHFGPAGVRDAERGLALLHQLKGEADEYARARPDVDLLSLKNACEFAVLLARRRA